MRLHCTFILRLLVDTEASGQTPELHGALQVVGEDQTHPFKSAGALVALLQELAQKQVEDEPPGVPAKNTSLEP